MDALADRGKLTVQHFERWLRTGGSRIFFTFSVAKADAGDSIRPTAVFENLWLAGPDRY
jgi:hypothetical protein